VSLQRQFGVFEASESARKAKSKQLGVKHAAPAESGRLTYLKSLAMLSQFR
jgi:hypothetical protein